MNKFLFLLIFVFLTANLSAYSKKIVLASFTSQERAKKMRDSLSYKTPTLYKMTKRYDFAFVIRKSGKYYMLTAEIFKNEKALAIVFREAKKRFRGAYYNEQTSSLKIKKIKKVQKVKIPKTKVIEVKAVKFESVAEEKIIIQRKKQVKGEVIPLENNTSKIDESIEKVVVKTKIVKKVEPTIKAKESTFLDYFHWSYIVLLIIAGVLTYYFIKFKKVYDEY